MTRTVTLSCDSCEKTHLEERAQTLELRVKLADPGELHFCSWKCLTDFGKSRGFIPVEADAQRGRK